MISSVMPSILISICSAANAVGGAGDLEIHVAEMILVTEDVGQHDEVVAFLDQTHRDTRDRCRSAARRHPSSPATTRTPKPSNEEPFDSVISETTRSTYGNSSMLGLTACTPRLARRP